jgi:hypothetical protein
VESIVDTDCAFGQIPNNSWLHVIVHQRHVSSVSFLRFTSVLICIPNFDYPDQIPLFYLLRFCLVFVAAPFYRGLVAWELQVLRAPCHKYPMAKIPHQ